MCQKYLFLNLLLQKINVPIIFVGAFSIFLKVKVWACFWQARFNYPGQILRNQNATCQILHNSMDQFQEDKCEKISQCEKKVFASNQKVLGDVYLIWCRNLSDNFTIWASPMFCQKVQQEAFLCYYAPLQCTVGSDFHWAQHHQKPFFKSQMNATNKKTMQENECSSTTLMCGEFPPECHNSVD